MSSDSSSDSDSDSDGDDGSSGDGAGTTIPAVVSGLSERGRNQQLLSVSGQSYSNRVCAY